MQIGDEIIVNWMGNDHKEVIVDISDHFMAIEGSNAASDPFEVYKFAALGTQFPLYISPSIRTEDTNSYILLDPNGLIVDKTISLPNQEVTKMDSIETPTQDDSIELENDKPEIAGYISSRPTERLQFNINTLKLGNLPGCYKMVKEEGGFFKALSSMWNAGEWFEDGPSMERNDTPYSFLNDMHYCSDTFWVNPKYANTKVSDLGEIGCRGVAIDGVTAISIVVYYKKNDGTVIAYDLNAC